jgi:hypothetical protein
MTVQIFLKIDRLDLAQKQVKTMQEVDDDDTLSTLAASWVNIALVRSLCTPCIAPRDFSEIQRLGWGTNCVVGITCFEKPENSSFNAQ